DGPAPSCDDGIACTRDRCEDTSGGCVFEPRDDECPSTGCQLGRCVPGTGCTIEADSGSCDDSVECTVDTCLDNGQCAHDPDATRCAAGEICVPAGCVLPPDCDASTPCPPIGACRIPTCEAGRCRYPAAPNGRPCGADPCVDARCSDGACMRPAPMDCGDDNPCTRDACVRDGTTGAVTCEWHARDGEACDDGDPCTLPGSCSGTICVSGGPVCAPGDLCNVVSCASGSCVVQTPACGLNAACDPSNGACACNVRFVDCDMDGNCECPTTGPLRPCSGNLCTAFADAGTRDGGPITARDAAALCPDNFEDCDRNGTCECNVLLGFCDTAMDPPRCVTGTPAG
ncbi:MAG: hypothetical protein K8H88_08790, partial [Sandaracinaceae bacterium]|nr:hypothetical protein [Sandaracinaceae bacterium]